MALPTLADHAVRRETRERLRRFSPAVVRQWGRMTPGEAVCHLAVCYQIVVGEGSVQERTGPVQRTLFKYAALHVPMQWVRGYPTLPELKAGARGVIPQNFADDRHRLLALFDEFVASPVRDTAAHPIFGALTQWEWMRWGYLHADHHLRQFGL
jgi:hypothetical protein